jgi:3-phenylpropionate/cinnamic acid dioxygenase small subunit
MAEQPLDREAAAFLYHEARLLDERRWEDWLALYDEDAVYWVPAFTMEGEPVTDPELSVNLIYITSRAGLEERIFRIGTGDSVASTPLPRTCNMVGNVLARPDGAEVAVTATFQAACATLARGTESRFGRYEYRLRRVNGGFLIRRKKILLLDDVIDGWFDVISI